MAPHNCTWGKAEGPPLGDVGGWMGGIGLVGGLVAPPGWGRKAVSMVTGPGSVLALQVTVLINPFQQFLTAADHM